MDDPSPFSTYLETNYTPSETELVELQRIIAGRRAEASELAAKIGEAMETQHATHIKFIQEHTRLISPIRRLPPEVMTMIFALCLEADITAKLLGEETCIASPSHPSVVLSHVCHPWRELVFGTPRLWSYISIQLPGIEHRVIDDICKKTFARWSRQAKQLNKSFKIWTKRSARNPLIIKIKANYLCSTPSTHQEVFMTVYKGLIDTMSKSSSRWQKLNVTLPLDRTVDSAFQLIERPATYFPTLKTTKVALNDPGSVASGSEQFSEKHVKRILSAGVFTAPLVRSATLIGAWRVISLSKFIAGIVKWKAITHLSMTMDFVRDRLYPLTGSTLLRILKALPNLSSCSVNLDEDGGAIPVEGNPTCLPNLKELRLTGYPVCKGFAPSLSLPLLDSLTLDPFDLDYSSCKALNETNSGDVELLMRFGHQLNTLSFTPDSIPRSAVSLSLQHLSNVVDLRIGPLYSVGVVGDDNDIFILSELTLPTSNDHSPRHPPCPRLKEFHMTCRNSSLDGAVELALAKFIASRRPTRGREAGGDEAGNGDIVFIRKVVVYCRMKRKLDVLKEVWERGAEMKGFDACLTYGSTISHDADD